MPNVGFPSKRGWCDLGFCQGRDSEVFYFRQEVLTKYEGASGFDVGDNGSVSHYPYWSLVRGNARIGNELIATSIGDFAEGIPFEEWQHWKQYSVEPPSPETINALGQEQTVSSAVNSLVEKKICSLSGRSVHPAATVSLASSMSSRFQAAR